MVIRPAFRMGQYRVDDHPYHAPQFTIHILLFRHIRHGSVHFIINHDIDLTLTWVVTLGAVNAAWYRSELGRIETNGFSILMDFKVKSTKENIGETIDS